MPILEKWLAIDELNRSRLEFDGVSWHVQLWLAGCHGQHIGTGRDRHLEIAISKAFADLLEG